jgi:hypothetical protein
MPDPPADGDDRDGRKEQQQTLDQADIEHSRLDRFMLSFPDIPSVDGLGLSTLFWIAFGVSHGALLIRYDVFPADYVILGSIAVATVAGAMKRVLADASSPNAGGR